MVLLNHGKDDSSCVHSNEGLLADLSVFDNSKREVDGRLSVLCFMTETMESQLGVVGQLVQTLH